MGAFARICGTGLRGGAAISASISFRSRRSNMPKKLEFFSGARDPENRSKKDCICGGHSMKHKRAKPKSKRKPWRKA